VESLYSGTALFQVHTAAQAIAGGAHKYRTGGGGVWRSRLPPCHSIVFNVDSSTVAVSELFGTASSESPVSVLSSAFTSTANPQVWQETSSTLETFSMRRGYRTLVPVSCSRRNAHGFQQVHQDSCVDFNGERNTVAVIELFGIAAPESLLSLLSSAVTSTQGSPMCLKAVGTCSGTCLDF